MLLKSVVYNAGNTFESSRGCKNETKQKPIPNELNHNILRNTDLNICLCTIFKTQTSHMQFTYPYISDL